MLYTMNKSYLQECPMILREFLGYIETIKGRSSHTADEYFTDLRTFFRYMKQSRKPVPHDMPFHKIPIDDIDLAFIKTITLTDVYEYMNYLRQERGNGNKTRARKTTSLKQLFSYLSDETHQLEYNPLRTMSIPKIEKSLPKYLTLEQSKQLLSIVASSQSEFPERDYCMLTLFLNCGLRRAELVAINLQDIRSDNTLRIHGKGNKQRQIYLNDACIEALNAYLQVRPRDGVKDRDALFLSRLKKRISLQGVHYIVKNYLRHVDGAEELSTHKLRHTAATMMYQHGHVDIRVLQEILGHENLGTTEIYTHLGNDQIQKAMESNPLSEIHPPKKKPKPNADNRDGIKNNQ